jgi:predicted metal-dependent enzyme (double-stranded beta helix superfamily)
MPSPGSATQSLIELLDEATECEGLENITRGVKEALVKTVGSGRVRLAEEAVTPCADGYGRRLVHRDPAGRYTVVAMVWGQGQGTPIHDHGDKWCVECVYRGEILVTTYDISSTSDSDRVSFELCGKTKASIGEAGALIPPHDYHVIENHAPETAVTIHVYGGEMSGCNVFEPIEGSELFAKCWKSLGYDE